MKCKLSPYTALFMAVFLLLSSLLFAEEFDEVSIIDSLLNEIAISEGWEKLNNYASLISYYKDVNPSECINCSEDFFVYLNNRSFGEFDKDKLKSLQSRVYFDKGKALLSISRFAEAIENFQMSLDVSTDYIQIASIMEQIGTAYYYLSHYQDSMDYYLRALTLMEDRKEDKLYGRIVNNLASLLQVLGENDQALEYLKESLSYKRKYNDIKGEAINLMNIGIIQKNMGDSERAEGYYLQALSKAEDADAKLVMAQIYNNMGNLYCDLEKYQQAENYYLTSLSIRKDFDQSWGMASIYNNIIDLKLSQTPYNEYNNIRALADSALIYAKQADSFKLLCKAYHNYALLEKGLGNSKASFTMMKKYYACLDSIRDFDQTKEILEMEGLLNYKTKISQINMFEKMNSQKKLELHNSNLQVIVITVSLILIIALTIILFLIYKSNKRFKAKIISINEEVEAANEQLKRKISELEDFKGTLTEKFQKTINDIHNRDNLLIIQSRYVALSDMIESISMKWKGNLQKIEDHVKILIDKYENNELNEASLEEIVNNCMDILYDMSKRIDDFRDFFRPQKAKSFFYVKDVITKAVGFVIDYYNDNNIKINIDDIEEDIRIDGYPNELALIVLNIINNSLDAFLARKTEDARIDISAETNFGRVTLKIQDNAGGVPEEIIDKIFEAFVTRKSDPDSSGLGLYIAREIVRDRFNGTINVSNENGGALVKIIF